MLHPILMMLLTLCKRLKNFIIKWDAFSRWSFGPNSAWGGIQTMPINSTLGLQARERPSEPTESIKIVQT